jgi:hypothetical protein
MNITVMYLLHRGSIKATPHNEGEGINIAADKITTFPIYNQKLAGFLMFQGYVLLGMDKNNRYPEKNVFYFKESDCIKRSIQTYFGKA